MLQQPQTYQAKSYVPVASAAIDPYEEARSSLVDDERLERWFQYLEAELRRYRSPFVAAEALLTEMRQHSAQLYQPERLYVNSALRVLQACVPHLSKETAEVVSAAIHELLPCLVYTRRSPLTTTATAATPTAAAPSMSAPRTYSEHMTQLTYAGAFRRILARWHQFQTQLAQQEQRVRVEVKVMDRLVHELDHMWVKTCFYSWRTYCRQLQARKAQLRRRLVRATANEAVPRFLRAWRQYAHTIALDAKTSRASALQQQVEALYPVEHEAKSRHDHLSEEIKEKNLLAGGSLQRLEETRERLRALEELIAETQLSLTDHWSTWKGCMRLLFGDVGKLPGKSDRTVRTDYLMNITDTASSLEKRAHTKAGRQGLQHIGKLLLYENALGIYAPASADDSQGNDTGGGDGGNSSNSSKNDATVEKGRSQRGSLRSSNSTSQGGSRAPSNGVTSPSSRLAPSSRSASTVRPAPTPLSTVSTVFSAKGVKATAPAAGSSATTWLSATQAVTTTALADDPWRVFAAVAAVTRPVLSPLHLIDVLHHNEPQLNLTIAFLSTLYSGGHCSLFMPALQLKEGWTDPSKPDADSARAKATSSATSTASDAASAAADSTAKALQSAQNDEEVHWGALMVQDVSDGMHRVQRCTDANEHYLMSVRQCMMSNELEVVQGYLEDLYARWATTGAPLSRAKLESVWEPIVSPVELPIIKALYPAQGILSFAELVDYVTRVAEFSGRPLLALAERLDATYPYDPLDELHIVRNSDEAGELFHTYVTQLSLLFEWLKDDTSTAQFRSDTMATLLETHLGLSAVEAAEVGELMKQHSSDVVDRDDVEWLLLLTAPYVDPSPFSTPLEKVANVLTQCTPLFAELGKASATAATSSTTTAASKRAAKQ